MSAPHYTSTTTSGIPFPQSRDQSGGGRTSSPTNVVYHLGNSTSTRDGEASNARFAIPIAPAHQQSEHAQTYEQEQQQHQQRTRQLSHSSHQSRSSVRGGESLPSIRNLLSSINNIGGSSTSSSIMLDDANNLASSPSSPPHQRRRQTTETGVAYEIAPREQHHNAGLPSSQSWDARMNIRSMSPTKRPPLAPSAYAHSHYMSSPHDGFAGGAYPIPASQRSAVSLRRSPASSMSGSAGHTPIGGSPMRSSGVRTGVPPASLVMPGVSGGVGQMDELGSQSLLAKRTMQSQRDYDEPPLSPASIRRRHTVGSLEEPVGILPGAGEANFHHHRERTASGDRDADMTPSTLRTGRLREIDSPTTPTAGHHALTPRSIDDPGHQRARTNSGGDATRDDGSSAVPHHVYLQHSAQITGSMPSLSSSVSSISVGSVRERGRVHSLEGQFDAKYPRQQHPQHPQHQAPPSSWHGVPPQRSASNETFNSPQSSVWHSRSSTLESIETNSSLGSAPSGGSFQYHSSHRHAQPQSAGTEYTAREGPTTPKHNRSDYNRDWRFPHHHQHQPQNHHQRMAEAQHHHQQMMRTRHESLSALSSSTHRDQMPFHESAAAGQMPASPFANLSLESPPANVYAHNRPRAQTMTYHDRQIAPLPSHSMHTHVASGVSRPAEQEGVMPQRSFSSHSTQSLPGRVSSMVIDSAPPGRSPVTGTMIVNAHGGVSVGGGVAGAAKYECGWCGKRFSRPSSLKIHHHSHTGEKPFVCAEPGCGRTFSVQSNLRRHQKSHVANARKLAAGGEVSMHAGMFGGGNSRVAPASGTHFSASSPGNGGGSHDGHGHLQHDVGRTHPGKMPDRFSSLRERKTSVSSSTVGDGDEDEEEEFDEDVDADEDEEETFNGDGGLHGQLQPSTSTSSMASSFGRGNKRMFPVEGADVMQGIREEGMPSSFDDRPPLAGSVQTRFKGLLNPGKAQ